MRAQASAQQCMSPWSFWAGQEPNGYTAVRSWARKGVVLTVENLWQIHHSRETNYVLLGRYIHHQTICEGTGSVVSYCQGTETVCGECCQEISTRTKRHRSNMLFGQELSQIPTFFFFFLSFASCFFRSLGIAYCHIPLWITWLLVHVLLDHWSHLSCFITAKVMMMILTSTVGNAAIYWGWTHARALEPTSSGIRCRQNNSPQGGIKVILF